MAFSVVSGGGIFVQAPGFSSVTNEDGLAAVRYLYGSQEGPNAIEANILGGNGNNGVTFTLTGALPQIELVESELGEDVGNSAMPELIELEVKDQSGLPLVGESVTIRFLDESGEEFDAEEEEVAYAVPSQPKTGGDGIAKAAIVILDRSRELTMEVFPSDWPDMTETVNAKTIDPLTDPEVFRLTPLELITGNREQVWLEVVEGQGQIGISATELHKELRVQLYRNGMPSGPIEEESADGSRLVTVDSVLYYVKEGSGKLDGEAIQKDVRLDETGQAAITLRFGEDAELHLVEVLLVVGVASPGPGPGPGPGLLTMLHFAEGAPEVYLVDSQDEQAKYIDPWDPFDESIAARKSYYITAKLPVDEPATTTCGGDSHGMCRGVLTSIDHAIAPVGVPNSGPGSVQMSMATAYDNFKLYRSDQAFVFITRTLEGSETAPPLPSGPKYVQTTGFFLPVARSQDEERGGLYEALQSELTAHRPLVRKPGSRTAMFRLRPITEMEAEECAMGGAGIRINGDDDNGNEIPDRNEGDVDEEDDFIAVHIQIFPETPPEGLQYVLRRSNGNIRVYDDHLKTTVFLGANDEHVLQQTISRILVEWPENRDGGQSYLRLLVREQATGNDFVADAIRFVPFRSIIVALGGHGQIPADPVNDPGNQGAFDLAIRLYQDGYNVHMFDEEMVDTDGSGEVLGEVRKALEAHRVEQVAIYGYSHGGGSTHDLAVALDSARTGIGQQFEIRFTAYIDAITNEGASSETRFPTGSTMHVNYYQSPADENDRAGPFLPVFLNGEPTAGGTTYYQENVQDVLGPDIICHFTIDDQYRVLFRTLAPIGIFPRIQGRVAR